MEEINSNNFNNFLERKFADKNVREMFFVSMISILATLVIGALIIFIFRGSIFGYFAREYLRGGQNISTEDLDSALSGANERQSIFSQDNIVIDAVKKTNPAVVSIIISKEVPKYETFIDPNSNNNPFGNFFPNFRFNVPQYRQNGTEIKEIGSGSGFFVSDDGLIVTNRHVVDATGVEYTVFTNDGKKHDATVVAKDPVLDIAIIKIDSPLDGSYAPLPLGNSDSLELGQSVVAIGNALGEFRNTVSVGVISGLARSIVAGDSSGNSELLDHVIQTDAAINPGNSGGPLLDLSGRVIGVNVAVAQGSQNIGFALPINSIKSAIASVKETGKIVRPYLGVRYTVITEEMKEKNNLTVDYGVLVKAGANSNELAVLPGSPADIAGIVENDIILEIDGVKLDEDTSLASLIRNKNIGDVVNLKILHKGVEKIVQVTLKPAPEE